MAGCHVCQDANELVDAVKIIMRIYIYIHTYIHTYVHTHTPRIRGRKSGTRKPLKTQLLLLFEGFLEIRVLENNNKYNNNNHDNDNHNTNIYIYIYIYAQLCIYIYIYIFFDNRFWRFRVCMHACMWIISGPEMGKLKLGGNGL